MNIGDKIVVIKDHPVIRNGTKGKIFWSGISKFNNKGRIGFITPEGAKHFIDSDYVSLDDGTIPPTPQASLF